MQSAICLAILNREPVVGQSPQRNIARPIRLDHRNFGEVLIQARSRRSREDGQTVDVETKPTVFSSFQGTRDKQLIHPWSFKRDIARP